jgi:hypothetical protein
MPLIGDLEVVTWLGNAPTRGPHLLHWSLAASFVGIQVSLGCSESV